MHTPALDLIDNGQCLDADAIWPRRRFARRQALVALRRDRVDMIEDLLRPAHQHAAWRQRYVADAFLEAMIETHGKLALDEASQRDRYAIATFQDQSRDAAAR